MKQNTETPKLERLKLVVGTAMAVSGVFTLVVVNAIFGYTNGLVWFVGFGLLLGGVVIAKSAALMQFLHDITR